MNYERKSRKSWQKSEISELIQENSGTNKGFLK